MKLGRRQIVLTLLLAFSIFGVVSTYTFPAGGIVGVASVTTPPLSTTTTASYTSSQTYTFTSTNVTTSTSISITSTSTTTTTTHTSFSYTATVSSTLTSTQTSTTYTSTQVLISTFFSSVPSTTSITVVQTITSSVHTVAGCPVAYATSGSWLEPYANFLRGFRNNDIQNTTAGRTFMSTFNNWYYSWAPSVTNVAANNQLIFDALRVGVYPLIGILYASYGAYYLTSPVSPEVGAITAGIVAASLIGLVYVGPVFYISSRIIRRRWRVPTEQLTLPSLAWFIASLTIVMAAYLTNSTHLLAVGTSSMVLSMLSFGSIAATRLSAYVQIPFANISHLVPTFRRLARLL